MSHQLSAVSYQVKTKEPVGWLERSETQQINEFLGERVKLASFLTQAACSLESLTR